MRTMTLRTVLLWTAALVALTACQTTTRPGRQVDDAWITTKIHSKFTADPDINPFKIDVDTQEGVVRLEGRVRTWEQQQEAGRLARDTVGVRGLINDLRVEEETAGSVMDDAWITAKVKTKLVADPEVNPFNIDVDTENGIVTLSGRVRNARQSRIAAELAWHTKGVRSVRNILHVGKAN